MLFNSIHFLVLLLLVIPVYFYCQSLKVRNVVLLAASYYFYMVFSVPLVMLLF